jgi:hypothetical protein
MSSIITIGGDLVVGRIGFGAMQLTGKQVWGEYPDRDGAIALLRAVVDAGVNSSTPRTSTVRTPTSCSSARRCTPTRTAW